MIFNTILSYLFDWALFIIGLLPNANPTVTSQISTGTASFRTAIQAANWIFPVDAALGFLSAVLVIELSIFSWKVIRWVGSIVSANLLH